MSIKQKIKRTIKYILHGVPEQKYITVNVQTLQSNNHLKGRNILITGGGRGLGYAIASKCISQGAKVVIVGRTEDTLMKAQKKLGANCRYLVFDVGNVQKIPELFAKASIILNNEKIDSFVSNAGISLHEGDFRNVTEEDWDRQFDINLKGNYFIVSEFIKYLEKFKDRKGNIVVITSERSKRPDDIPYGLTKVATNSLIQGIASKVAKENIRINGVGPGVTVSDMTGFHRDGNLYAEWQPTERIFLPEEVAEVVDFLLNDASNCINGEIIVCDAGRYISTW